MKIKTFVEQVERELAKAKITLYRRMGKMWEPEHADGRRSRFQIEQQPNVQWHDGTTATFCLAEYDEATDKTTYHPLDCPSAIAAKIIAEGK